jgi:hypothetical protein
MPDNLIEKYRRYCLTENASIDSGSFEMTIDANSHLTARTVLDSVGDGWLRFTDIDGNVADYAYPNNTFNITKGAVIQFDYVTCGGGRRFWVWNDQRRRLQYNISFRQFTNFFTRVTRGSLGMSCISVGFFDGRAIITGCGKNTVPDRGTDACEE